MNLLCTSHTQNVTASSVPSATRTELLQSVQTEARDDVYKVVNLKQSGFSAFAEFHPQRLRPVITESLQILHFSESSHSQ